ncbi:hypothetical protein SYN65AY6LI_13275 [Synechococcus sp. 65AY6Li]|nr:hypothetical protein SYN65AY6LI_13275 [Synechococcus sp. 65AY6Li]
MDEQVKDLTNKIVAPVREMLLRKKLGFIS